MGMVAGFIANSGNLEDSSDHDAYRACHDDKPLGRCVANRSFRSHLVMSIPTKPEGAPDLAAIKQRQQATWASGDFAVIGTTLQLVGESLAEAVDVRAGERVLDVAAGNGNATLAAARRFADVVSTDYVPDLLGKGSQRATAEGLDVAFQVADAEALPFADGRFDVVLSTFGMMFAPDQHRAAAEAMRVLRPGGRLGLANWTSEGFIGRLFRVMAVHLPPPAGLVSPAMWGSVEHLQRLFERHAADWRIERRVFKFRYRSAEHWVQVFRDFYGPTHKAFGALQGQARQALKDDMMALLEDMNVGGAHSLVVPSEYLEVVITKKAGRA
jgi:ubiquinone/menaquinone biosynthesis C-methylase UbiE